MWGECLAQEKPVRLPLVSIIRISFASGPGGAALPSFASGPGNKGEGRSPFGHERPRHAPKG